MKISNFNQVELHYSHPELVNRVYRAVEACVKRCVDDLDIPMPSYDLSVFFANMGRIGGQAVYNRRTEDAYLRLSWEATLLDVDRMVNEIIPHEVAHIACSHNGLDRGHGRVWKALCRKLGGTGYTTHDMPLTPVRTNKRFMYTATCGAQLKLTSIRHNRIQSKNIKYKLNTGGLLSKDCAWVEL